ncbi:MAG: hypothetical protein SO108_02960 [Bacilli bacterium]|nr:hypothetical protein [Bacilli bacterium]
MIKEKLEYQKYFLLKKENEKKVNFIATMRVIFFLMMIFSFVLKYYYYPRFFSFVFLFSLLTFVILVIIHDQYFQKYNYYESYLSILEEYIKREDGTWKVFEETGEEFEENAEDYLKDLDIIGKNSLFQYISVCKTIGGKRTLFQKLSNKNQEEEKLYEEQNAIAELEKNLHFVMDYQVQMRRYDKKKVDLTSTFLNLKKDTVSRSNDFIIALICGILSFVLLGLSLLKVISIKYFYGLFLFNYLISLMYSLIYQQDFNKIIHLITTYHQLSSITSLVLKQKFSSKKLKKIQKDMDLTKEITKKINILDTLNSMKDNLLFSLMMNGLFCINLFMRTFFIQFLKQDFPKLQNTIIDIEELEALISLTGIGILKEEKCFPVKSNKVEIKFMEIKHPLLKEEICVDNDFDTKAQVNIITGSNMGGKTSFLRTIGINIVLMNAGTYVCAKSFRASYLKIFTSMRVGDDIEKGISTFYGELLRIKKAMDYLNQGNMLVLIDEIFKGTNYQDRIYGAKKVIQRLQNQQVITFLTTHDFELCDEKNITNYHVKEYYEGDQIQFDYKIRKGKCTSTNAKYLMEKLEII